MKCEVDTLKQLLTDSSVVYLSPEQLLYKANTQDNFVYFVLFGWLSLVNPSNSDRR